MKRKFLLLATMLAIHSAALAETKVPSLINYQGHVTTSAGAAIGAGSSVNRNVTFRFWKSATDTSAASRLYSETQTVTILNGDFSVLIGSGAAVVGEANSAATVAAVFANKEVFLGITVDDGNTATTDAEVSPRQQLVSTAFAFRASVAESVDNAAISNTMLAPNAVDTTQIAGNAVTAEKIAAGAVTTTQIADGAVTSADIALDTIVAIDIAAGAVGTSEILDASVTTAKIATDTILAGNIAASAVGTSEILDGTVATADIGALAVTTAKIATDTIVAGNIAADAVGASEIAASAVGTSEIADGTVTGAKLGSNTTTSVENLRMIRGTVRSDGVIVSGAGFTVSKVVGQYGLYNITFTTAFTSNPSVTIELLMRGNYKPYVCPAGLIVHPTFGVDNQYPGSAGFTVAMYDNAGTNAYDRGFQFIAVGPR